MKTDEKQIKKLAPNEPIADQEKGLVAVDPEMLIAKAIEKGLPVETMENYWL